MPASLVILTYCIVELPVDGGGMALGKDTALCVRNVTYVHRHIADATANIADHLSQLDIRPTHQGSTTALVILVLITYLYPPHYCITTPQ